MADPLFPTTVIGSLPRPAWLKEVILQRKAGDLSERDADAILDRAIESALLLQERAGVEELTDGEWRRESYVKIFAERVRGFKPDLNTSGGLLYPAVVDKIEYHRALAADEVRFIRGRTGKRVKATLPSPYIIGRRMWNQEHSSKAYPTAEKLMEATVPVLRQEIEALKEAGADTIQLDEPSLSTLVDPAHRKLEGIENVEHELDLCVDVMNQVLDGISGIDTAMHLCHAHYNRQHVTKGSYDLIMPALARIRVGTICMEYATPDAGGLESLASFPEHARLGFGCIDHTDTTIEQPEDVVARVEAAMRHVPADRITLHPDCGFSPSVQNPMDLDEAYLKLKAMCEAASILRQKHS
jgi:5-methyltetrahydropteroyltriglutamate--homocysteine methyltransferase